MREIFDDYLFLIVNTILFISAISFTLFLLSILHEGNNNQIQNMKTRSSVFMDATTCYDENIVLSNGTKVFEDVMNQNEHVDVYIDSFHVDTSYIQKLHKNEKNYITDLRSRINMNDNYLIKYTYNEHNEIIKAEYVHD